MWFDVKVRSLNEIPMFLDVIRSKGIKAVAISSVSKETDSLEVARLIREAFPALQIALVFSAKIFTEGSIESARIAFRKKFDEAKKLGMKRFIFVSGYPRVSFDSLEMLRVVDASRSSSGCEIICAYNPYFDPGRLREEQDRLRVKLGFPFVQGIALQIGMDAGKLQKGVESIQSVNPDVRLFGYVPIPNALTLECLRADSPHGVFLPNSYLLSPEIALEMTSNILNVFHDLKIEPIAYSSDAKDIESGLKVLTFF
jgi:hypothetical protein